LSEDCIDRDYGGRLKKAWKMVQVKGADLSSGYVNGKSDYSCGETQ